MVAVQYSPTILINTGCCDCTTAHACQVVLSRARARPSVVFQQSKCKDVFHMRSECSLSNASWQLVLTCHFEVMDTFPEPFVPDKDTVLSYVVNCLRDTGTSHRVASDMRKGVNARVAD